MDLPKNITQIGEADAKCKIYVEDYVVSFLKQLNPLARDKTMAAALYGRRATEEDKTYLFVYGAGKLDFIQRETRHLSQAQKQEIEKIRSQYFRDYEFLGYRILDGEMVEGFHVCEQDICRYISGYAQFFEKNEAMLSYMLESRQEEAAPESVDREKYDMVRDRQDRRRARYTEQKKHRGAEQSDSGEKRSKGTVGRLQGAAAAVFAVLCVLGIAMNSSLLEGTDFSFEKWRQEFMEKKLPDDTAVSGTDVQTDTLLTQDKLSEAVQIENGINASDSQRDEEPGTSMDETGEGEDTRETGDLQSDKEKEETPEETDPDAEGGSTQPEGDGQETESQEAEPSKQATPVTYIVCKGDTLTGISIRTYGSDNYVSQICKLNGIKNPDKIQVGQKILLP